MVAPGVYKLELTSSIGQSDLDEIACEHPWFLRRMGPDEEYAELWGFIVDWVCRQARYSLFSSKSPAIVASGIDRMIVDAMKPKSCTVLQYDEFRRNLSRIVDSSFNEKEIALIFDSYAIANINYSDSDFGEVARQIHDLLSHDEMDGTTIVVVIY